MEIEKIKESNALKIKRRGFAAMDPAKRSEIARKGGKVAQALGKGHRFSQEEARIAGQKGGRIRKLRRQMESQN